PARAAVGLYEALIAAQAPVAFTSIPVPTLGDFESAPAVVELRLPDGKTRVALWTRELPEVARLDEAAARYRLPPGRVIRVASAARDQARLDERAPTPLDVTRAVSAEVAQKVAVLGTRIDDAQTWDDVVLPAATMGAVQEIVSRARHRHRVLHEWGFERKLAKGLGLSALFAGPPGTGKTMVAGLIARELALELYQIDLSRVVSKYVGETEKNLAEVFDAADWGNVLLLFDEADALFSRRTDVKSSNDRFANMEINYLLQRLERFEGVSILTTNLEGSIDTAFKRRLSFRVGFPMPDASEREVLWRRMVPTEAPIVDLDVAALAQAYEFTGGNIRNAMLRAAYLAASEGAVITTDHVHRAVTLEYHDAGQLSIGGKLHQ
ncbi:MAG: ATP-binding protein, partial [Deltaproteobacteria bacterium]|nr:ATP-binding protein [Deltaproteobacteria bacterium]